MIRSSILRSTFVFFTCLGITQIAVGQADTARLQGTVTDAQGAAITGATVTVTNTGTSFDQTTTTNELGYYTATALPPGHYRIEVSQSGFKKAVREIDLQVAQVALADFSLEVGEVTQSVTVEASQPVINPADSALGEVVESRQVTELPLNGRNFTQLATLVPGVNRGVPTGSATGAGNNAETFRDGETGGASLSVNGLRPQNNNFILDGIDNNETLVNTIVFFPPADAIDEFRVQTSVAPAEYGRAGGALIVTTLKSGTNDWHGSVFWFNRNTNLNARDFFNNGPTPGYNRNQFGVAAGGPIIHNKFFIFGDYQGLRKRVPGSNDVATVPTDLMRQGNFSELLCGANCAATGLPNSAPVTVIDPTTGLQFMGSGAQPNVIPQSRINQVGLAFLKAFPEPNCTPSVDSRCHTIEQNYHNVRKIDENWNDFDIRGDYIIDTSDSVFVRYSHGRADQTQSPRLTTLPSGFGSGTNFNHPDGASIGWTRTITSSLINEARVGFVRTVYGFQPPFGNVDLCTQIGIVNCNTPLLGGIALIGGFNGEIEFTGDFGPFLVPQTSYNANDTVSWSRGKHTSKFGTDIIRRDLNLYRPLAGKGFFNLSGNGNTPVTITGYEVSDLLAGFVNNYSHGTNFGMIGTRTWENGVFAQDDWRFTPRLTFNLGLRYDVYTWPVEVQNRQSNFNIATGAIQLAGKNGASRSFIPNDYNNFGPRIGFAYQLTGDGKTVVRGGYGIFYFLDRGGISNQLGQNAPFGGENQVTFAQGFRIALSGALPCSPNCTQAQLNSTLAAAALPSGNFTNLNLANPSGVSLVAVLPKNVTPNVSQWNLQVQRQVDANSSVSLAYVGDRGKNLTRNYNINQQLFGKQPNQIAFPNLGNISLQDTGGSSVYHSLQAQYERRFANGFQFLGAFTWSKTIDDSCGDLDSCAPQLFSNFKIERGRSNIDQDYRMVLSSLYELPFGHGKRWGGDWSRPVDWIVGGWQVNGIYTLEGGLPFSVTVDGAPGNVRADLKGSPGVRPGVINCKPSPCVAYINETFQKVGNNIVPTGPFLLPAFANGVYSAPGTSGRNILRGPGSSNLDFSLFKDFQATERIKVEVRGQAYNLTNTPHFANPNADLSSPSTFGEITSTQPFSYRQLELALRVTF